MSYHDAKRERERAFIESIHGNADPTAPGLPPIRLSSYDPRPMPVAPSTERGWGPEYEVDAELFFPSLRGDDG